MTAAASPSGHLQRSPQREHAASPRSQSPPRPHRAFEVWTWANDVFDAVVCAGGTCTYLPGSGALTVEHVLHADAAACAAAQMRGAVPGVRFAVETGHDIVAEPGYAKRDSVMDRRRALGSLEKVFATAAPALKLLAHLNGGRAEDLERAARALDLDGVLLHQAGSRDQIEFGPSGVDKATGLAAWCRSHGIEPAAVVAFGDAPADAPMLAWAGRSYAVANAHPIAAAAAAHRCAANVDDGVAEVIETILSDSVPDAAGGRPDGDPQFSLGGPVALHSGRPAGPHRRSRSLSLAWDERVT